MGIINHDTITLSNGITLTDTYLNLCDSPIIIVNKHDNYDITYYYNLYASQSARENLGVIIQQNSITLITNTMPFDIYTYCYTNLKTNFSNFSDC